MHNYQWPVSSSFQSLCWMITVCHSSQGQPNWSVLSDSPRYHPENQTNKQTNQVTKAKAAAGRQRGNRSKETKDDVGSGIRLKHPQSDRRKNGPLVRTDIDTMGKPRYSFCLIRESGWDADVPEDVMLAKKGTWKQILEIFHNVGSVKYDVIHWPRFRKDYDI